MHITHQSKAPFLLTEENDTNKREAALVKKLIVGEDARAGEFMQLIALTVMR